MTNLNDIAKAAGFFKCFVLPPMRYPSYERRLMDGVLHPKGQKLVFDPAKEVPFANAILLLLWPYAPLPPESQTAGYYLASNASYHASARVLDALAEAGIEAVRCDVPVRESAMAFGIGSACRNGLTAFPGCGTRVAVQTLAVRLEHPTYSAPELPPSSGMDPDCAACGACMRACPVGAIDENGYHYEKCLRAYMTETPIPAWVMERMPSLIGCELCQYACPKNRKIAALPALPACLSMERLLTNDVQEALQLVGKNQNKGGLLPAHACVMAANGARAALLPLIEALTSDARPMVRAAANYAISRLREA